MFVFGRGGVLSELFDMLFCIFVTALLISGGDRTPKAFNNRPTNTTDPRHINLSDHADDFMCQNSPNRRGNKLGIMKCTTCAGYSQNHEMYGCTIDTYPAAF